MFKVNKKYPSTFWCLYCLLWTGKCFLGWGWNFKWIDSVGNIVLLYYIFHRNIPNRTYNKHKFWQTCLNLFSPEGFFSSFLKNLIFSPGMNILVKVKKKKSRNALKCKKNCVTSHHFATQHPVIVTLGIQMTIQFPLGCFLNFF